MAIPPSLGKGTSAPGQNVGGAHTNLLFCVVRHGGSRHAA